MCLRKVEGTDEGICLTPTAAALQHCLTPATLPSLSQLPPAQEVGKLGKEQRSAKRALLELFNGFKTFLDEHATEEEHRARITAVRWGLGGKEGCWGRGWNEAGSVSAASHNVDVWWIACYCWAAHVHAQQATAPFPDLAPLSRSPFPSQRQAIGPFMARVEQAIAPGGTATPDQLAVLARGVERMRALMPELRWVKLACLACWWWSAAAALADCIHAAYPFKSPAPRLAPRDFADYGERYYEDENSSLQEELDFLNFELGVDNRNGLVRLGVAARWHRLHPLAPSAAERNAASSLDHTPGMPPNPLQLWSPPKERPTTGTAATAPAAAPAPAASPRQLYTGPVPPAIKPAAGNVPAEDTPAAGRAAPAAPAAAARRLPARWPPPRRLLVDGAPSGAAARLVPPPPSPLPRRLPARALPRRAGCRSSAAAVLRPRAARPAPRTPGLRRRRRQLERRRLLPWSSGRRAGSRGCLQRSQLVQILRQFSLLCLLGANV